MVREDPDRRQPELRQDLRADPVLVHRRPRRLPVLTLVTRKPAHPAVARDEVEEDALLYGTEQVERVTQVLRTGAGAGAEDVTGQAFGMHANEDVAGARHLASDERNVVRAGQNLAEADGGEVAVHCRK